MSTAAGPAPSTPQGPSLPHTQASALLTSFTDFLTIAVHSLLYYRSLYPSASFLTARAYNLPVHQSRHPLVCSWIRDAVSAASAQLYVGAVKRIVLAIHGLPPKREIVERWVFDVQSFPVWGKREDLFVDYGAADAMEQKDGEDGEDGENGEDKDEEESESEGESEGEAADGLGGEDDEEGGVNWTDVNEELRGALRKIAYVGEGMPPLPNGCIFTLALELRDEAEAPLEHPQPWIPSPSDLQPPTKFKPNQGSSLGGISTTPVRSVRADPLFFECWVEQANSPDSANATLITKKKPSSS